jgi:predicted GNAT family acetyltransferase
VSPREGGPDAGRPSLTVRDVPARQRYEARTAEGALAGWVEYERDQDTLTLRHTIVPPAFEGRGVGSSLVADTLADLREHGSRVVARCPFVVSWLRRHPAEQDILAEPLPPDAG